MPTTEFTDRVKAQEIAAKLNADPEDDWTYEVVGSARTRFRIAISDEHGEFVGLL